MSAADRAPLHPGLGKAWPGSTAGLVVAEPMRLIAADHPDRLYATPSTNEQVFLRVDATHELPLVVTDARGREIARFARPGDCALAFCGYAKTLPAEIVRGMDVLFEQGRTP